MLSEDSKAPKDSPRVAEMVSCRATLVVDATNASCPVVLESPLLLTPVMLIDVA